MKMSFKLFSVPEFLIEIKPEINKFVPWFSHWQTGNLYNGKPYLEGRIYSLMFEQLFLKNKNVVVLAGYVSNKLVGLVTVEYINNNKKMSSNYKLNPALTVGTTDASQAPLENPGKTIRTFAPSSITTFTTLITNEYYLDSILELDATNRSTT